MAGAGGGLPSQPSQHIPEYRLYPRVRFPPLFCCAPPRGHNKLGQKLAYDVINPKAVQNNELYGYLTLSTGDWTDGIRAVGFLLDPPIIDRVFGRQ